MTKSTDFCFFSILHYLRQLKVARWLWVGALILKVLKLCNQRKYEVTHEIMEAPLCPFRARAQQSISVLPTSAFILPTSVFILPTSLTVAIATGMFWRRYCDFYLRQKLP
jgi:hypothetical protein